MSNDGAGEPEEWGSSNGARRVGRIGNWAGSGPARRQGRLHEADPDEDDADDRNQPQSWFTGGETRYFSRAAINEGSLLDYEADCRCRTRITREIPPEAT